MAAPRQHLSRPEKRLCDIFATLSRGLGGQRVVDGPRVSDLRQCPGQVLTDARPFGGRPPLVLGSIDLTGARRIVDNAPIDPARGFQTDAVFLGLLDHRKTEGVVVEAVIAPQIEELALLRPAVQHEMRMRVIPVLMHRDDVVEMPLLRLEEPLGHIRGNVAHILPPCPDGKGHEQMRGLSELGFDTPLPPLGKAFGQLLDLSFLKPRLAVQNATAVDDMAGFRGEILELVGELGLRMRAPAADRLEDRWPVTGGGAQKLFLLGDMKPLHRAPDTAPAIAEHLSGDRMDRLIQPHAQTPSRRPSPPAASRRGGDE